MSHRPFPTSFSVIAVVMLVSLPAAGQDASSGWELPRTPDGRVPNPLGRSRQRVGRLHQ